MWRLPTALSLTSIAFIAHPIYARSINEAAYERCIARLVEIHRSPVQFDIVDEYEKEDVYHMKGNYSVFSHTDPTRVFRFERDYYHDQDIVDALPFLDPFDPKQDKFVADVDESRLDLGGDACPNVESWRVFIDEFLEGNIGAELSTDCMWLARGTRVYGPILAAQIHKGYTIVQLRLRERSIGLDRGCQCAISRWMSSVGRPAASWGCRSVSDRDRRLEARLRVYGWNSRATSVPRVSPRPA